MRSLSILVTVVAVLGSTPAFAKGPALTWRIDPETPVAGQPASIELRTWEWTPEGEPDTTRPSRTGFFDKEILRLPVRAYPASRFPHVGPGDVGISLARMVRISPSAYRGSLLSPARATGCWPGAATIRGLRTALTGWYSGCALARTYLRGWPWLWGLAGSPSPRWLSSGGHRGEESRRPAILNLSPLEPGE